MVHTYFNAEITRRDFRDSSPLINWILDSDATYHMTPEISDFIQGSLMETNRHIGVAYGDFITLKQTR